MQLFLTKMFLTILPAWNRSLDICTPFTNKACDLCVIVIVTLQIRRQVWRRGPKSSQKFTWALWRPGVKNCVGTTYKSTELPFWLRVWQTAMAYSHLYEEIFIAFLNAWLACYATVRKRVKELTPFSLGFSDSDLSKLVHLLWLILISSPAFVMWQHSYCNQHSLYYRSFCRHFTWGTNIHASLFFRHKLALSFIRRSFSTVFFKPKCITHFSFKL